MTSLPRTTINEKAANFNNLKSAA